MGADLRHAVEAAPPARRHVVGVVPEHVGGKRVCQVLGRDVRDGNRLAPGVAASWASRAPNRTLEELREYAASGGLDPMQEVAEAFRDELSNFHGDIVPMTAPPSALASDDREVVVPQLTTRHRSNPTLGRGTREQATF